MNNVTVQYSSTGIEHTLQFSEEPFAFTADGGGVSVLRRSLEGCGLQLDGDRGSRGGGDGAGRSHADHQTFVYDAFQQQLVLLAEVTPHDRQAGGAPVGQGGGGGGGGGRRCLFAGGARSQAQTQLGASGRSWHACAVSGAALRVDSGQRVVAGVRSGATVPRTRTAVVAAGVGACQLSVGLALGWRAVRLHSL
jgi:hypothetical protein